MNDRDSFLNLTSPLGVIGAGSRVIVSVVYATLLAFHLLILTSVPSPFPDDGATWYQARTFFFSGSFSGTLERLPSEMTFSPPSARTQSIAVPLYSLPYLFSDSPSLHAMRLVQLAAGFLLLACLTQILSAAAGTVAALFVLLISGTSIAFVTGSHLLRTDLLAVLCVYSGLSLHWAKVKPAFWTAVACGFVVGAAPLINLRSIALLLPVAVIAVVELVDRRCTSRTFGGFVLGGFTAALVFVIVYLGADPAAYWDTYAKIYQHSRQPPLLSASPEIVMLDSASRIFYLTVAHYGIASAYLPVVALHLACFGNIAEKRLLLFAVLTALSSIAVVQNPLAVNFILVAPALEMVFAAGLSKAVTSLIPRVLPLQIAACGVMLSLFALPLAYVRAPLRAINLRCETELIEIAREVRNASSPDGWVIGAETFWMELQDSRYISWKLLPSLMRNENVSLEEAVKRLSPSVVIRDGDMDSFMRDSESGFRWYDEMRLPRTELQALFDRKADLRWQKATECFGNVKLYTFNHKLVES